MVASNEIVQNSSKTANGYKSILVNLVNKDLEDQFRAVGIEVRDLETGALKPAYDLLQELSVVFNELGTTIDDTSGDTISLNENMNALLEDIAGKYNINVLSSGLLNFNQAISATETSINSAGSAEEEFTKALDSIKKKLEGVQGQFLELVSGDGGLSNFIKLLLDGTTAILEFANSGLGQFIIQATATTIAITLLYKGFVLLTVTAIPKLILMMNGLLLNINMATLGVSGLTTVAKGFMATLSALNINPVVLGLTALVVVAYGAVKAYDHFNVTLEESVDKLKELKTQSDSTNSEIESIAQQLEDVRLKIDEINKLQITDSEDLAILQEEENTLARQLALLKQKADIENYETTKQAKETLGKTTTSTIKFDEVAWSSHGYSGTTSQAREVTSSEELAFATEEYRNLSEQYDELKQKSLELTQAGKESTPEFLANSEAMTMLEASMQKAKERAVEMSEIVLLATEGAYGYTAEIEEEEKANYELIDSWNEVESAIEQVSEAQREASGAQISYSDSIARTTKSLEDLNKISEESLEITNALADEMDTFTQALEEQEDQNGLSKQTQLDLIDMGYASALMYNEETKMVTLNKDAVMELAKAKIENQIADLSFLKNDIATKLRNDGLMAIESAKGFMYLAGAKTASADTEAGMELIQQYNDAEAEINVLKSMMEDLGKAGVSSTNSVADATQGLNDELEDLKDQYEDAIDYVLDKFDDQIDGIEKVRDAQIDAVEKERDAILDGIDDEIDALERQKEIREAYWDDRIDKLKQENTERERAIQLEQYQEQLALAQSTKVKIYEDGQFVYGQDEYAVSSAEQDLFDYEQELSYQRQLEELEYLKQVEMNSYDSRIQALENYRSSVEDKYEQQIEALEEYYNNEIEILEAQKEAFEESVNAYEEEQDRLLASQLLGIDLQQENWTSMIGNLESFVNNWNSLLAQMNSVSSTNVGVSATSASVGISSYASGNPTVKDNEIALVGENPKYQELVIGSKINHMNDMGVPIQLSKGSGVLPASQTNTLVDLLASVKSPSVKENITTNNSGSNGTILQIQSVNVNANNADEFISSMKDFKNKMIQETYK